MGTKVYACAYLLALVGVVLALAGPVAGYGFKATFAASGPGSWSGDAAAAALRRLMSTRLEDGVAPELTVDLDLHRRVLAGGSIRPPVLDRNKPACIRSCPAPGEPYIGPGCQKIYHCRSR